MRSLLVAALVVASGAAAAACGADDAPRNEPVASVAVVGRTYAFELYTHCGIEWAWIDGAWWQTPRLGNGPPPPGWDNPYHVGRLTVTSVDTATFTGGPGTPVEFRRTAVERPPYVCR